jgi:host factor-I protein
MSTRDQFEPAQDPFLNQLRKTNTPVTIYLTNGLRLEGIIASFDVNTILLKGETVQVLYKHLVATIQRRPAKARVRAGPQSPGAATVPREFREGPNTLHLQRVRQPREAPIVGANSTSNGATRRRQSSAKASG